MAGACTDGTGEPPVLLCGELRATRRIWGESGENLGRDPKKSYNFFCESGYFVNYCSLVVCKISSEP